MTERDEEEQPSRPKVVDKRISAGGHEPRRTEPATPHESPPPARERNESSLRPPPAPSESPEVGASASPPTSAPPTPGEQVWTPEQEEQARRMIEEIAKTPSLDWVLNAAVNLANVAGTKLEMGATADAQLAIDALAGIVNSLGDRLQEAYSPLRQTLAQLQLAFAQRSGQPPPPEPQTK